MNNLDKLGPGLVLGLALFAPTTLNAQLHGHLNAGAVGTNQNDALIWANGADFAANSGYVKTLDYTNSGRYAGYFQQNITLTALPATPAHAGPDPQAPALGSYIQARMSCVAAPPGRSIWILGKWGHRTYHLRHAGSCRHQLMALERE